MGKTRRPAMIAFRWPTLLAKDTPVYTSLEVHPIRRMFGFAIGNTVICIARCDPQKFERLQP